MRREAMGRVSLLLGILVMGVLHGSAPASAQQSFFSARYISGDLPAPPVLAVSGGEVFLEVLVAADGHVDSIRTLRATPPFTDAMIAAVRGWWFEPATKVVEPTPGVMTELARPVADPVFVAGMFAPPALNGPTLGEPPQDLLSASSQTPSPKIVDAAAYPPRAWGGGAVLVEVTIDPAGAVGEAQVRVSSPGFDAAAVAAARSWSFKPAHRDAMPVITHAYLVFVFRPPV
jgi:TonB family protein